MQVIDRIKVDYDEFTSLITFYYHCLVTDVNAQYKIIPSVSRGGLMSVRLGFIRNGWLFFESAHISIDEQVFSFGNVDPHREVLSGGNILEVATVNLQDELLESLIQAEQAVIRFTGQDNQTVDHHLTQEELNAFKVLGTLNDLNVLSRRQSWWEGH